MFKITHITRDRRESRKVHDLFRSCTLPCLALSHLSFPFPLKPQPGPPTPLSPPQTNKNIHKNLARRCDAQCIMCTKGRDMYETPTPKKNVRTPISTPLSPYIYNNYSAVLSICILCFCFIHRGRPEAYMSHPRGNRDTSSETQSQATTQVLPSQRTFLKVYRSNSRCVISFVFRWVHPSIRSLELKMQRQMLIFTANASA